MNSSGIEALRYNLESALINAIRNGAVATNNVDVAYQRGLKDAYRHVLGILGEMSQKSLANFGGSNPFFLFASTRLSKASIGDNDIVL